MKRCGSRSHFSWTDLIFKMHTRYFSVELLHCSGCNGSITAASIKVKLDRLTTNGCYWRQWDKIRQFNKISILAFCRRLKLPPSCVGVSPPSGGNGRHMPSGPWWQADSPRFAYRWDTINNTPYTITSLTDTAWTKEDLYCILQTSDMRWLLVGLCVLALVNLSG